MPCIYYITDGDKCGSTIQIKLTVAFPLQKWLCQHTKVLQIVHNTCVVTSCAHVITGMVRISGPIASVQTATLYINSEGF